MNVVALSAFDLSLAATLVLLLAGVTWWARLGLAQRILVAATRTVVQLTLVGLVLKWLFAQQGLTWIALITFVMLIIAGREVMVRQHRRYRGTWGYGLGTFSIFISSFSVGIFVLTLVVGNTPWYTPQYAVPLMGMMLGNTMTAVALSLDNLTTHAWQQRQIIEARLAMGQGWHESMQDIARGSIRVGLVPIINAMAIAGVVNLPGMMTGQILGGTPPVEAVKYQILIMFMVAAGSGSATLIAVWLGARHLFDERQRLRLERLHPPQ